MKNFIFTFALMLAFTFGVQAQFSYNPKVKIQPKQTIKTYPKINPKLLQKNCPDLAAVEIRFQKLSGGAHSGRIRVHGTVKNVGKQHFISNPGQAYAILYEVAPNGRTRPVDRRQITNLPSGRTISLRFDRSWYTGNEFPPNYKLMLVYDPDIRLDRNPKNDDCNAANNRRTRSGSDINRLFRAGR